jgi:hypothetical protein
MRMTENMSQIVAILLAMDDTHSIPEWPLRHFVGDTN